MSRHRLRTDLVNKAAEDAGDDTSLAIARRAGLANSTITRLLDGETTPSVATLIALRDAYGFETLDELLTDASTSVPDAGKVPA